MPAGLGRGDVGAIAVALFLSALAGWLHVSGAPALAGFGVSALALAAIAHLIGESTDQLGNHLGAAATGIIQSAVGNPSPVSWISQQTASWRANTRTSIRLRSLCSRACSAPRGC